jgi:hypothetical protein
LAKRPNPQYRGLAHGTNVNQSAHVSEIHEVGREHRSSSVSAEVYVFDFGLGRVLMCHVSLFLLLYRCTSAYYIEQIESERAGTMMIGRPVMSQRPVVAMAKVRHDCGDVA